MPRTKHNEAAMQYAIKYLDTLLDMEVMVNKRVEQKLDRLAHILIEKERQEAANDGTSSPDGNADAHFPPRDE